MRYLYDLPIVKVRAWLEIGGTTGDGLVNVGENTTLSVHTVLPRYVGAKIVDCQAFDGLGESSQKLFDEEGCPLDLQVYYIE